MGWKRWLRLGTVVSMLLILYFAFPVAANNERETVVRLLISVVTIVGLAAGIVWQLRTHIDDTSKRVDGLIISIVLVVVVFAHIFFILEQNSPDQFADLKTRLDALYFATSTLATVGFGDVHATGQIARALVLVQMVFNVVFVATTATLLTTRVRMIAEGRSKLRQSQKAHDEHESS
jgi:voltage-gated potassium channel